MLTYEGCGIVLLCVFCVCVCVSLNVKFVSCVFDYDITTIFFLFNCVHDFCVRVKCGIYSLSISCTSFFCAYQFLYVFFFHCISATGYVSILDCVCQENAFLFFSIRSHVIDIQHLKVIDFVLRN